MAAPRETWSVRKPAVESAGGLIATQHDAASAVGAAVLARGGNAVDAAIAAGFAIAAVEPWMSGLGGGGFMTVKPAGDAPAQVVDFGMVAPAALDPADYPLSGETGGDMFGWPAVVDDRNIRGYHAIAVPGQVAGLGRAHERFGTQPWRDLLQPAIALAEAGMEVDWYATVAIAAAAADLARTEPAASIYLPDGRVPAGEWSGQAPCVTLAKLGETLGRLASAGARDFYEGEVAQTLVRDLAVGGSRLSADDLAGYDARIVEATAASYRDATVWVAPGLTAGPTLQHALSILAQHAPTGAAPDGAAYCAIAASLREATAERLATMGDTEQPEQASCTTHISVVDRDGMAVALTQTLLSPFGSKVVLPETGILMNNGIMWFDPRPGRPNAIGPGKRPLSNMCPTVIERADGFRVALGASGGRRIMPSVFQLIAFLVDHGMTLDEAIHCPRVDTSTDIVAVNDRLSRDIIEALRARFTVEETGDRVYPVMFACPNGAGRNLKTGWSSGAAFVMSPRASVRAA